MANLKRDLNKVLSQLFVSGNTVMTKSYCKIQVPKRFEDRDLCIIGRQISVYGLFALILEDGSYAVRNTMAMMQIEPYKTETVLVNGVEYYEFHFYPNSVVISNTSLVKEATVVYYVMDELIFQGKIPWYIGYEDMAKILDSSSKHAGSSVNSTLETIEMIDSAIARESDDLLKPYRYSASQGSKAAMSFVPMVNVYFSAAGTVNKLGGNYFQDGVIAALVNPSTETSTVEEVLRA